MKTIPGGGATLEWGRSETSCHEDGQGLSKVSSEALLSNRKCLIIEHDGCEYTLRLTKQNKLILTK